MTKMSELPDYLSGPAPKSNNGWRTMESYKLGDEVLLCVNRVVYKGYGDEFGEWYVSDTNYYETQLSHPSNWRPLPKLPETE